MIPRGIRNNNPLNIRRGCNWLGLSKHQTDPAFCQFDSMTYGLRAGLIIIRTYMTKYKLTSIHAIVSRWAPPSENNTDAYVKSVASMMRIHALLTFDFSDRRRIVALVSAMCKVETGITIDQKLIESAYDLL
mgnify:FL=1